MHRPVLTTAAVLLSLVLSACNLPLGTAGAPTIPPEQAAGATVAALLETQQASQPTPLPPPATDTPPPPTLQPTVTSAPPSPVPTTGCTDMAQFVSDVTIPDGALLGPGASFTKTWRLKNAGSCTWTSSYALVFFSGDQMSAPAAIALAADVPPGTTVDVSANMAAPGSNGSYQGNWKLRNSGGVLFGIGSGGTGFFWVKISVGPTPTATLLSLHPIFPLASLVFVMPVTTTLAAASGTGGVFSPPATIYAYPNAGDDGSNRSYQGFVTFDLSAIPSGSSVTAVKLDLSDHDVLGSPFSLGCLRAYVQDYGALQASDFFSGVATGALWRFCSEADLANASLQDGGSAGVAAVQSHLASGKFQIRLQFSDTASNGNSSADALRPTPKLVVTYTP